MIKIEEHFKLKTEVYNELLEEFNKLVNVVGYKTQYNKYQKAVREFLYFFENQNIFDINHIHTSDLVKYHEYLSTRDNFIFGGKLSRSYIASHMYAINLFFDYLTQNRVIKGSIILPSRPVGIERNPVMLTQEEIGILYKSLKNKRDKAFISIAYGCGLRRSELVELNVTDILLKKGILIVRSGKNDKRREVPLSNHIIEDIEKYLFYERDKHTLPNTITSAFFVSNSGKRMSGNQLYLRLKSLIKKTKNIEIIDKNITLHSLRHSISSHLIDNGATIEYVKKFLGHCDIDTSHIYVRRRKMKKLLIKNI